MRATLRCGWGLLLGAACGDGGQGREDSGSGLATLGPAQADDGSSDAAGGESSSVGGSGPTKFDLGDADEATGEVEACPPPDLLLVLDRSYSMHQMPDGESPPDTNDGYESSKWFLVIDALEGFMQAYGDAVHFGLELFPAVVQVGSCASMPSVVGHTQDNDDWICTAEVLTAPAEGAAELIAAELDPFGTPLCKGTPIQIAVDLAAQTLADTAMGQEQYAVLLTDGKERCAGNPIGAVQQLHTAGIRTFVIGFGDTHSEPEGHMTLNHLACAGGTAPDFPVGCHDDGFGNFTADAADDIGVTLYLAAEDAQTLATVLEQQIAGNICCGSACPPG